MEHAFILAGGGAITSERTRIISTGGREAYDVASCRGAPGPGRTPEPPDAAKTLKEIEMDHIFKVLEKHKGNKPAAATELGIVLKTLYNKLNQWEEERKSAG